MNHADVQRWLDRYVEAWRANVPEPIAALFTEDVAYHYRPYDDAEHSVRGREAIVSDWLEEPDWGAWEAHYEPYAVEGDRAVAVGWTRYAATDREPPRTFHNAWLLRFAEDGRCAEFREFYMRQEP
jgi:ketosteroid isomerase-like protein